MAEPKWDLPVWQPAGLTGLTHSATPVRCPASVASPHSPVEPHQRSSRSPARSQASPAESLRIHQRTKAENGRRTHTAIRIRFRLSDILTVVRVPEFCSNSQVFPARWRSPSTTPKDHDGIRAILIMDWIDSNDNRRRAAFRAHIDGHRYSHCFEAGGNATRAKA
jgi:hypothetical protein